MNEISLTGFIRACEMHNLSKAAQELHISQPALSRRIIALEEEIGMDLLKRSNTGVELTEGGKLFYKEAKKLVIAEQELREKMKEYQRSLVGSITIGCHSRDYVEPLVRAAKALKEQYPGIEIEFKDVPHDQAVYHYLQENVDMAYVHKCDVPKLEESIVEVVAKNIPVALVSNGHRFWERETISLDDLIEEPLVFSNTENDIAKCIMRAFGDKGLSWESVLVCESHIAKTFKILSGKYISIGGQYSADGMKSFEEEIRLIPIIGMEFDDLDYCVVYQASNTNAVKFVDCLLGKSERNT